MEKDDDEQLQLLTTPEAAALMRTPLATLRGWRREGKGPTGFRLGARKVMYKRADVEAFIEKRYRAALADAEDREAAR